MNSIASPAPIPVATTTAAPRKTIRAIDGMRGVAAMGIVMFHMAAALAYSPELFPAASWFGKYFMLLDLFFVASGYGIASGYARTFADRVTARGYGRFLWARFIRLYPLYIFVLAILVGLDLFYLWSRHAGVYDPGYEPFQRPDANWGNLVAYLFMVQSWGFTYKLVWDIPAWYVSALICAYLAFPFIAWGAARLPQSLRGPLLILLGGGGAVALHIAFRHGYFSAPNDMSPLRAILEFTLGYGLAQLKPGPAWRSWLQIPLLALVFVAFQYYWRDEISLVLLTAFLWSLLDDRGIVAAILGSAPLVWLGSVSMGIFLIHQPMLFWFDQLERASFASQVWILWAQNFTWNIAVRLILIIFVGWLLQRFVAAPAQRWLQPAKPRPAPGDMPVS